MQIRSFRVPFDRVMATSDAPQELDFGPGDYLVVRPLFSQPTSIVREIRDRVAAITTDSADADADALTLTLLGRCVAEWHLDGPDGPIALPASVEALNELPSSLRGGLFGFLIGYRGDGPDPTPAA